MPCLNQRILLCSVKMGFNRETWMITSVERVPEMDALLKSFRVRKTSLKKLQESDLQLFGARS